MSVADILGFSSKTLLLVLYLSLPPIVAAAVVGTVVALLQALTQLQEQTLSFAVKLVVIILILFATARWLGTELFNFADQIFKNISTI